MASWPPGTARAYLSTSWYATSTIANNGDTGLVKNNPANSAVGMFVTRSTITGNNIGWTAGPNPGLASYGDCNIDGNNSANSTPGGPAPYE